MERLEYVSYYGTQSVAIQTSHYVDNGNIAISLSCIDEDGDELPYIYLSVNLREKLPAYYAYVNTNNAPGAIEFIEKNGLGEFTGRYGYSGYCSYPLYKFDKQKLYEYSTFFGYSEKGEA